MSLHEEYGLGTGTISGPLPQIHLKDTLTGSHLGGIGYLYYYRRRVLEICPQNLTNLLPFCPNSTAIKTKFGRHVRIDL